MEPLLIFPDPANPDVARALDLSGWEWVAVADVDAARRLEPSDGWNGAIIAADTDSDGAFALCRSIRKGDISVGPVLLMLGGSQLTELELRDDLFDDFCLTPFHPAEFDARLRHVLWRSGRTTRHDVIQHGPLLLNLETYQAMVDNRPLDLTYMEYELLKFLASRPGQVFNRETLLNRVWGYDYFGGARTVDVHVRRLRAKLGEEHAPMIQTVRSVGYSLGQSRWAETNDTAAAIS